MARLLVGVGSVQFGQRPLQQIGKDFNVIAGIQSDYVAETLARKDRNSGRFYAGPLRDRLRQY